MKNFRKLATSIFIVAIVCLSCNKDVESVTFYRQNLSLNVGKTTTLTAEVKPAKAKYTLTWASSNAAIATVDAKGVVTAHAAGTATITATAGDKTGSCTVTVENYVSIKFGNTQWVAKSILASDNTYFEEAFIHAAKESIYNPNSPYINLTVKNQIGTTVLDGLTYALKYSESTDDSDQWEQEYLLNPIVNITAFGNGKISGNATVVMYNYYEKIWLGMPDYTTKTLEITFKDVTLIRN